MRTRQCISTRQRILLLVIYRGLLCLRIQEFDVKNLVTAGKRGWKYLRILKFHSWGRKHCNQDTHEDPLDVFPE